MELPVRVRFKWLPFLIPEFSKGNGGGKYLGSIYRKDKVCEKIS